MTKPTRPHNTPEEIENMNECLADKLDPPEDTKLQKLHQTLADALVRRRTAYGTGNENERMAENLVENARERLEHYQAIPAGTCAICEQPNCQHAACLDSNS